LPSVIGKVKQARHFYKRSAWDSAYHSFLAADRLHPLDAEDLELLATSGYMAGRPQDFLKALERAHQTYLREGQKLRAGRCGFGVGLHLMLCGEGGPATGWFARVQRLIEGLDCAEHGYLLLPAAERELQTGNCEAAYANASNAAAIGLRFDEPDLITCARHLQGRAVMHQGNVPCGLALLDEVMVAVTGGEVSPIFTGLIYCSVIEACQQVYAFDRAREWTHALSRWCNQQPELVAFTATCLVHRAQIMKVGGAWRDAIEEVHRASRASERAGRRPPAAIFYEQAEVHRLQGEFRQAEDAYRKASEYGLEPQPGLALLRLAQGRNSTAVASICRVLRTATGRLERLRLLPAYIEISLASGDVTQALIACRELEEIVATYGTPVLQAIAAQARGSVSLAAGNAAAALDPLRSAWLVWQKIDAPYLAARVRELLGLVCRALGDQDGAALETHAARAVFLRLGAAPDLARIDSAQRRGSGSTVQTLTMRERQVLRLVAAGKTNKMIAAELQLSKKTIDRHVENILTKLAVSSRAGATAYAYQHNLI
jgi:DNA-binding NarL/FixJ family response regulator